MINQIPPDSFFMVSDEIPPLETSGEIEAGPSGISNYFLELITDYLSERPLSETKPVENEVSLPVEQELSSDSSPKEALALPLENVSSVETDSEDDDEELLVNPALTWLNAIHNESLTLQQLKVGEKVPDENLLLQSPVSDRSLINQMQKPSLSPIENNNENNNQIPQKGAADIEFTPIDSEEKSAQVVESEASTDQIIETEPVSEDQSIDPQKNLNADIKETLVRVIKPDFAPSHSESKTSVSAANRFEISAEVNESSWQDDFNARVTWLGQHKINQAILKLNPVELGPVEVKIHLSEDSAKIDISTHSLQVQDLIEQSIPRLREMLMSQGVQLSEVNIETGDRRSRPQNTHQPDETLFQHQEEEGDVVTRQTKGIVDYFA
ncbi:flagellar hook-length control protein FliK [Legionella genomosp. 1]|uniref:flagellar hook-length control protein FliK n=1 Tax=Legionella genomosp. 1 TaxID=1093625 RepID=UPI0013EF76AF|nr:flagellar hook-length control protein FliK [Legionella genomosp. 1]